jgi:microcystin-dependent protein
VAEPFLSEIRIVSFDFAPKGWAMCNGQTLPINQNQALFSLLGTTYGGNGETTFQLPNLQGRVALHQGSDPAGNPYNLGQEGGQTEETLTVEQLAAHSHPVTGVSNTANEGTPVENTWADSVDQPYGTTPNVAMNAGSVSNAGGGSSHSNVQPYLTLNFIIALQGIYPTQN